MVNIIENCNTVSTHIQDIKCLVKCLKEIFEKNMTIDYDFSYLSPLAKLIYDRCDLLAKDYTKIEEKIFLNSYKV